MVLSRVMGIILCYLVDCRIVNLVWLFVVVICGFGVGFLINLFDMCFFGNRFC